MKALSRPFWVVVGLVCSAVLTCAGADWPMWRCGATRSGASPDTLPASLHLQWVRDLPAALLAWPNEPRLHFDASYEPVVLGQRLFLGSPNDGSVVAFATDTGAEQWRFYTGGPVRFAPVAWRGRVYAGSDDGWLYCLDAAKGTVLWKARGAPDGRPDRRHLGNARLISLWPVRGGPVLAGGIVYFAAGIWPTLGVFVVAVDAETGRLVWRNGDTGFIEKVRIDHNVLHEAGLAPQGYLAVQGDMLVVPNGRSMPAILDRATGRLLRYVQGYRNGDCRVAVTGHLAFVGRGGVADIRTGREVGSRWAQAGKDAPNAFVASKFDLFEGPIFPYKLFAGCTAWSAFVPGIAYGSHRGTFYAYDLARAAVSEYDREHAGHKLKPWRWDAPALWTLPTEHAKQRPASTALIKAGSRLYGHAGRTLLAIAIAAPGGKPRIVWRHAVDGAPSSMLAADGKLFVVTREGAIHCFGAGEVEPKRLAAKAAPLPETRDRWTAAAARMLKRTGVSDGYALVLGIGSGRLVEELLRQSALKVVGVGPDAAKAHALRRKLAAAGLYGSRAEVFVGAPGTFPLPPYLASLVVSGGLDADAFVSDRAMARLWGVLRPYGGTACLAASRDAAASFRKRVASSGLEGARVSDGDGFVLLRRAGPLPGTASWTHETADAARSYFSRDRRVRAPLGVLWYGDGPGHGFWKRKDYGIGVKPQVIGGRLFAFQVGSSTLFAYDVFTGRLLWRRKVKPFTRYASMADGIYVAGGDACVVHDPATGEPLRTLKIDTGDEKGRMPFVADIRVSADTILIALAFAKVRVIEKGLWDSTLVVALDRKTGRQLWRRTARHRFNNHALALGGGMAFCIDSVSPIETDEAKRRGDVPDTLPSELLALDARTGEVRWRNVTAQRYRTYARGHWLGIRGNDDWLAYCETAGLLVAGKHGQAQAFEAATGKRVWQRPVGGQPLIVLGKTFISQGGAQFETRTGKSLGRKRLFQRGGCNYAVANPHLAFLRDRSASYVELKSGEKHYLRNVRAGCSNSMVAADGVLSVPNFAVGCVCNYPIQTSFAMVHMPEVAGWAGDTAIKLTDQDVPEPARPQQ